MKLLKKIIKNLGFYAGKYTAAIGMTVAVVTASQARAHCTYIIYQPDVPKKLQSSK